MSTLNGQLLNVVIGGARKAGNLRARRLPFAAVGVVVPLRDHASTTLKVTNIFPGKVNGRINFLQQLDSMYALPKRLFKKPLLSNVLLMPLGTAANILATGSFNNECCDGGQR